MRFLRFCDIARTDLPRRSISEMSLDGTGASKLPRAHSSAANVRRLMGAEMRFASANENAAAITIAASESPIISAEMSFFAASSFCMGIDCRTQYS